MALSFHQLHIFFAVVEKGSFSGAAQSLYLTQPAVTMQIQSLEEHFGVKLFQRSAKKVELTDAGRALLPFARRSLDLMRETDDAMSRFTQLLAARLQLGASLTVGEYILPRLLGPFGKEHPHISISMKVMNTSQIMEDILQHQLSFGIVEALVDHADMHVEAVLNDELKLVVPGGHPLLAKETITLEDALEYPFVLREMGSGTRRVMEEALLSHGCDPRAMTIVMDLGSTGAVKSAVEANLGVSILSKSAVRHEEALGLLQTRTIEGVRFVRSFYAIYLKSAVLPIPALTFLNFIRERDLSQWL